MANTTKAQAITLVIRALNEGHILQSECAKGHITCGPVHEATAARPRFGCYLYTRSCPSGDEIGWACLASDAALTFVDHTGRGAAGRVARAALGI